MKPFNRNVKRITRLYYWIARIICDFLCGVIYALVFMEQSNQDPRLLTAIFCITAAFHVPYLVLLTIKRFHDAGKSTGYAVLCLLLSPFVLGQVMILLVAVQESDRENEWGPNEEALDYEREKEYYAK